MNLLAINKVLIIKPKGMTSRMVVELHGSWREYMISIEINLEGLFHLLCLLKGIYMDKTNLRSNYILFASRRAML